jgi:hypothetical protein
VVLESLDLQDKKRLMGFEPTTFCMAIREVIDELSPSISMICRAFVIG